MNLTKLPVTDELTALVARDEPQMFTPQPPEPEPEHQEEAQEPEYPTAVVEVTYHHDRRCSTGDLIGAHVVASFADRQ